MNAKWLHEIKDLLTLGDFRAWFDDLEKARLALREASQRYEELLAQVNVEEFRAELAQKNAIDTLYKASEYEDAASQMLAEATDLENRSLEGLGSFESQRVQTSEYWFKLEAIEHSLDEAKRAGHASKVRELERSHKKAKEDYERESAKKQRLWEEVESLWSISLEKNLFLFEKRMKGKLVRQTAEHLFTEAEGAKQRADGLKAESEAMARERERLEDRVADLITRARDEFGAILLEDFLYWQQRENEKAVWVTPLFSNLNDYNLELKACKVYQCDRGRGVEFLEPAIEAEPAPRDDQRLDDFFLKGRPSRKHSESDTS